MAQPKMIEGTGEELQDYLKGAPRERFRLYRLPVEEDAAVSPKPANGETTGLRDPELVARVRSIRGKYAGAGEGLASEELHRERQRDKEKEERLVRGDRP